MDMTCRPATAGDISQLLPMMAAFNAGEGIEFEPARFEAMLAKLVADPQLGAALVFETPDICGYAVVTWNFDLEFGGRDGFLTEFWVQPSQRGKGHGRAALAHIEHFARAQGAAALHLGVRHDNTPAVRLYESSGYEDLPRRFLSKNLLARFCLHRSMRDGTFARHRRNPWPRTLRRAFLSCQPTT